MLSLKLGLDYKLFNVQAWLTTYAERRHCDRASLKVCTLAEGSVVIGIDAFDADHDALLRDAANSGIDNLQTITDPRTGQVVPAGGGGLSTAAIVGIIVGSVVFLALLVVAVVLLLRRNKERLQRTSIAYQPLMDMRK